MAACLFWLAALFFLCLGQNLFLEFQNPFKRQFHALCDYLRGNVFFEKFYRGFLGLHLNTFLYSVVAPGAYAFFLVIFGQAHGNHFLFMVNEFR